MDSRRAPKVFFVASSKRYVGWHRNILTDFFTVLGQILIDVVWHTTSNRLSEPRRIKFCVGDCPHLIGQVWCASMPCPDVPNQNASCRSRAHSAQFHPIRLFPQVWYFFLRLRRVGVFVSMHPTNFYFDCKRTRKHG